MLCYRHDEIAARQEVKPGRRGRPRRGMELETSRERFTGPEYLVFRPCSFHTLSHNSPPRRQTAGFRFPLKELRRETRQDLALPAEAPL